MPHVIFAIDVTNCLLDPMTLNHYPKPITSTTLLHQNPTSLWSASSPKPHHGRCHNHRLEKQREIQNEGLCDARDTITVVAVLIAMVTFSAGINPPGGFSQDEGKAINYNGRYNAFKVFMVLRHSRIVSLLISFLFLSVSPFQPEIDDEVVSSYP